MFDSLFETVYYLYVVIEIVIKQAKLMGPKMINRLRLNRFYCHFSLNHAYKDSVVDVDF